MQKEIKELMKPMEHLNGQKILVGLSGGINSAAVLCHLKESGIMPSELHLFYVHFKEHSPGKQIIGYI